MVYLYWLGAFAVVTPFILGLPFLSRNRVYRIATLFAGMNVGIVTLSFFINLLRWGIGPAYAGEFQTYFMHSLPSFYIASLTLGATIVSKYYVTASTKIGAISATSGTVIGVYFLGIATAKLLGLLHRTITEGMPSLDIISDMASSFVSVLIPPDLSLAVLLFVSAFIALNGTAAIMRMSDETEAE